MRLKSSKSSPCSAVLVGIIVNQYVLLLVEEEVRKTLHIGGEVGSRRSNRELHS